MSRAQAETAARNWLAQSNIRLDTALATAVADVTDYGSYYVASLLPEGFVVISADSMVPPVIAFSGQGVYVGDAQSPLTTMLTVDMPERLEVADAFSAVPTDSDALFAPYQQALRAEAQWTGLLEGAFKTDGSSSISDVRIAPFLRSEWSQGSAQSQYCYNYYTPNHDVAGCVAIAMAQVIRYFEYPSDGVGRYTNTIRVDGVEQSVVTRGGDGAGGAYTYAQMTLKPASSSYNADQWKMIGALCYDCGVACRMSYTASASSAYYSYARDGMLNVFGFGNVAYSYNSSGLNSAFRQKVLLPNLAAGLPIMLGIHRSGGGHAVICDGWGYSSGTEYHHINMGWGGYADAWYNLPTVDAGSYNYTVVDALSYNIFTNGTGELIAGRITDNNASAVSGAVVSASGGYVAATDANGYYALRVPASATYSLTATKPGYAAAARSGVSVGASGTFAAGNYWGANMTLQQYDFSFKAFALTNNVVLRWTNPSEAGMLVASSLVRRSTSVYPATINDGTQVYKGTNCVYTDDGLTPGQLYYYTIWVSDGTNWVLPPDS